MRAGFEEKPPTRYDKPTKTERPEDRRMLVSFSRLVSVTFLVVFESNMSLTLSTRLSAGVTTRR